MRDHLTTAKRRDWQVLLGHMNFAGTISPEAKFRKKVRFMLQNKYKLPYMFLIIYLANAHVRYFN